MPKCGLSNIKICQILKAEDLYSESFVDCIECPKHELSNKYGKLKICILYQIKIESFADCIELIVKHKDLSKMES